MTTKKKAPPEPEYSALLQDDENEARLNCGCLMQRGDGDVTFRLTFCPMHDGAENAIRALKTVSFYARINHGDKSRDYGEIVDPVLKKLGIKTGEL